MSDLTRRLPFDVRPRHRESVASYTRRLLAKNSCTEAHKNYLARLIATSNKTADLAVAWKQVLPMITKRCLLHLEADPGAWTSHADGTTCEFCTDLLTERPMCTLCSHGEVVEQNPHFDNLVCVKHGRWLGISTPVEEQHHIGEQHITAELQFRKLRRNRRIDVRFYILLRDAVTEAFSTDDASLTESDAFPKVVAAAAAVTAPEFSQVFFDPSGTYSDAHRLLVTTVEAALGAAPDHLVRAIWLYVRPTVWAVRHTILSGEDYTPGWPHDFPLDARIANQFVTARNELEPFKNYLEVTGDDPVSAARFGLSFRHERRLAPPTVAGEIQQVLTICSQGHQFETDRERPFAPAPTKAPKCPACRGHLVIPNHNDLASVRPDIAAEFDVEANGGLTAENVATASGQMYWWRCTKENHPFQSTASNRTSGNSGCPVCLNRVILAGVNDVATLRPDVAAEWHPSEVAQHPPTQLGIGSNKFIQFLCGKEHEYRMSVADRVERKGCPECVPGLPFGVKSLAESHPEIAAQWHPDLNGYLTPDLISAGSRLRAAWLCDLKHYYFQRVERRTHGHGCPFCSGNKVREGFNDIGTSEPVLMSEFHPYLNGLKTPGKMFAGTDRYWWKCKKNRHENQQSIPNRRLSNGCTECSPSERILAP